LASGIAALSAALALSACGGSADSGSPAAAGGEGSPLVGAGSTTQLVAQESWIEEFEEREPAISVSYEPAASGGRQRFIAGDAAYAATDSPLEGAGLRQAVRRCRPGHLVEVPAYLSKIKVGINVGSLAFINLTPRTLARVFNGGIERWSDPEIRRENPTVAKRLDGPITILYPAGKSGLTANLTEYLSEAAPKIWRYGSTEAWPLPTDGIAVSSSTKMAPAIDARRGAIGFADASQSSTLRPVLIKVGNQITPPDLGSSISVLEASSEAKDLKASPDMLPFDLERPYGQRNVYPLVFTSYLVACTRYDRAGEGASLRRFLEYAISPEGQEVSAREASSDPLAGKPQKQAEAAVRAIE